MPDLRVFQGREKECSKLNAWLADPDISMMAIRGEGGIGKSTLMAKVFAESQGFAGKFWADVRTGTPIAALAERSLQEFGVLPEQVRSLQEKDLMLRLLRQLQQGRYLLAIDNLESVLTATGDWQGGYEEFLDGFQSLGSESVLLLAGREYPPKYFGWRQSRWLTLENGLTSSEGAALLERLDVADTIENRATVSEQVQGNPLALSLIAGWLRDEYRQPEERLVCHLNQHTDLFQLVGKHRGEANISVDRVLQWSVDRLASAQQDLLTQVSVLRGAFDAELATALVLEPPVSDADLHDLERRSLLQELPKPSQDAPRLFQLQPRIREFVQKQVHDLTLAHERAIAYFWSHRQTEFARDDTQAAASHYEETFYHLCKLGHYEAAATTVFACDEFLRRRGYYQLLVNLYSQLHTNWQPRPGQQQNYASVCNNLGNAYNSLAQYQQAIAFHQQSLEIAREIGDRNREGGSLCNLGNAYQALGQYQQAIKLYQQALDVQRSVGNRKFESNSLGGLGDAYRALGEYEQAIDFHQQSLAIRHEIGDRHGEASSLGNLGNAYYSLGQYEQAINFQQQSLAIQREIGDRNGEANSLGNLGSAYNSIGQYPQAINFHQQSLAIDREIGDRDGEATSLLNMGNALARLDQHYEALQSYQQALVIYEELKLNHKIEQCKTAIAKRNKIIPVQLQTAPTLGAEKRTSRTRQRWWRNAWFWFAVGLAIALLIWWLR
ncbi:MAG TPA: tetratricopeptide repeat protein [Candidatus Obscuribacterales bacterium]